jgi:hypothetical protein
MTFSGKSTIRISLYLLLLAVPGIAHGESFNEVYEVVKKAIDTGEDAVDTANRALDTLDEFKDIAKDVADLISTTAKVYQPLRKMDVLKLWLSEVPRSTIIEVIQRRKCGFEISADEIIYLKSKKMNSQIIRAMVKHSIFQSACRQIQLNNESRQRVKMQRVTGINFDRLFATYLSEKHTREIAFADYAYGKKITETNVGMGLTIAGATLNATGGVLGPVFISRNKGGAAAAVMIPTLTVGTSLLIPGLVLWIRGYLQSERIFDFIEQHEKSGTARSGFQFAGVSPLFFGDEHMTRSFVVTFQF